MASKLVDEPSEQDKMSFAHLSLSRTTNTGKQHDSVEAQMPLGLGLGLGISLAEGGGVSLEEDSWFSIEQATFGGLNDITFASFFNVATFTAPDFTVSAVRVRVQGRTVDLYIGPQASGGDQIDASALTAVTFSGSNEINQTSEQETLSDLMDFTWNKTDNIVTAFYSGATGSDLARVTNPTGAGTLFISGNDASTLDKEQSSYTITGNLYNIKEIIFFGS